jgi:hypothetical protein
MELEENDSIPFLDVLINMKSNGNLGHTVYRKNTHTKNYLHANSHHHPNHKLGVLKTLATRAIRISDEAHLDKEIDHLTKNFKNIGYKHKDIKNEINRALERTRDNPNVPRNQNPNRDAYLPYIQGVTDRIARVLSKKEIKTSFKPLETIKHNMRSVKDKLDPHKGK